MAKKLRMINIGNLVWVQPRVCIDDLVWFTCFELVSDSVRLSIEHSVWIPVINASSWSAVEDKLHLEVENLKL